MKSASKAQVPDLISTTIKAKKSMGSNKPERSASTSAIHRRSAPPASTHQLTKDKSTASVDTVVKKPTPLNVKARYLEPKRPKATAVPNNNRDAQLQIRNRSSSGSSRNSSPCILQNGQKALSDSITLSRDSLASPAKKVDRSPRKPVRESSDQLSQDSLAESVNSRNKTTSQDSLARKHTHLIISDKRPQSLKPGKNFSQSPSVQSSTPSSITTLKSRLSTNSTVSSPRDLKSRHSTPANPAPATTAKSAEAAKKSFLSARSRQILAKKNALSHSDSAKSVPCVLKPTMTPGIGVNKSQSASNILTRKPNPFSTTLHLRRTAKVTPPPLSIFTGKSNATNNHSLMNPTKSSSMKSVSHNNKLNREYSSSKDGKPKPLTKRNLVEMDGCGTATDDDEPQSIPPQQRIECKLERSSTFCKEKSEIPTNALQIIE